MCYDLYVTPRAPGTAGTSMRPIELQMLADNGQDIALVSARKTLAEWEAAVGKGGKQVETGNAGRALLSDEPLH